MAEEKILLPEDDDWLNDLQDMGSDATAADGLGQSDIDKLLNGGLGGEEAAVTGAPEQEVEIEGLDQTQVDELLGSLDDGEEMEPLPMPPGQDEIDQLFDAAKSVEEQSTAKSEADFDSFDLDFDTIEADDFGFGEEIATIPDETAHPAPAAKKKEPAPQKTVRKTPRPSIPWLTPKKLAAAAALLLVAGLGSYGYLWLAQRPKPAVQVAAPQPPVAPPKPVETVKKVEVAPPDQPPEAIAFQYNLEAGAEGGLAITLAGRDEENQPLSFQLSRLPLHGRLSGAPPILTYQPDRDFPGKDSFEYTVSDGRLLSPPVAVIIIGPDLRVRQAKVSTPRRPKVTATNITMTTMNNEELRIDWARIWGQSNRSAFNDRVKVEIKKKPQHGSLSAVANGISSYRAESTFSGRDEILYRFEKDGSRSETGLLKVLVGRADTPPEPELRPLARTFFLPGETVVLDARPSRDDSRGSLEFNWRQLTGTPVLFKHLNDEGSMVSFVVPSSFRRDAPARLRFQLTVVDRYDQLATAEVEIQAGNRRHSALWPNAPAGIKTAEGLHPDGDPHDAHLPWPQPGR